MSGNNGDMQWCGFEPSQSTFKGGQRCGSSATARATTAAGQERDDPALTEDRSRSDPDADRLACTG